MADALSVRPCEGVDDLGGGVGVEATGGVLDCWALEDVEAGAFMADKSRTLPSESLMTIAALFLGGRAKVEVDDTTAGGTACAGRCCGVPCVTTDAWFGPMLDGGRSETCDVVRDMAGAPVWAAW